MPYRCANTPPRSISYNNHWDICAFSESCFAISFSRRLISAGLPPSRSSRFRIHPKVDQKNRLLYSSTRLSYNHGSRSLHVAQCAPLAESRGASIGNWVLSNTGFMCTERRFNITSLCLNGLSAASFSPPSLVTALFKAMFCGLKVPLFNVLSSKTRHKPATNTFSGI